MKLFFTKTLGVAGDTACVTCHHPLLGGGDGVQISIGTGATDTDVFGYDRVLDPVNSAIFDDVGGGPTQTVNAPTSYNAGLHDRFMAWHGIIEAADPQQGKNGSVGGLYNPDSAYEEDNSTRLVDPFAGDNIPASQARFPVQNPIEMAGHDPLIKDLSSFERRKILLDRFTGEGNSGALGTDYLTAEQRAAWKKAFDDAGVELNDANIYNMISYYERTQLFIENPWKQYVEGNLTALSDDAKKEPFCFSVIIQKAAPTVPTAIKEISLPIMPCMSWPCRRSVWEHRKMITTNQPVIPLDVKTSPISAATDTNGVQCSC